MHYDKLYSTMTNSNHRKSGKSKELNRETNRIVEILGNLHLPIGKSQISRTAVRGKPPSKHTGIKVRAL